jgi:low affinity Fe/Cu permease
MEEAKKKENKHRLEHTALAITRWIGSPESIFIHTLVFAVTIGLLVANIFPLAVLLLIFNTAVSLEAIYLALFIQMTVNYTTATIEGVEQDIDEIQVDIGEMQEDVEEIQEDVDELQEDVEEMSEEEIEEEAGEVKQQRTLEQIHEGLQKLMLDVEKLQSKQ